MKLRFLFAILSVAVVPMMASAQVTRPAFPQKEGIRLNYIHHDSSNERDAVCTITLRNVSGDNANGSLEMVYNAFDKEGDPYFKGANEFVMKVDRIEGQTYITMDKMAKTLKIMNLITAGDASAIRVPMTVGDTLPDTHIYTTLGLFKATLTISDKKVLDYKILDINGNRHECWLVHEKILTETPFSTDIATADTWYSEGIGCVSQTVYDAKGELKGKLELKVGSTNSPF